MPRLSINLSDQDYAKVLKAIEASGKTIEEWIATQADSEEPTKNFTLPPEHIGKTLGQILEDKIGTFDFGPDDLAERDEEYLKQLRAKKAD